MIPVSRPLIGEEECEAAARVLRSCWLSTGPESRALEGELSALFSAHTVCVSSGSMALELALIGLGVKPGDEVIVPAITFVATSHVAVRTGARVVFADIDPRTGFMDPEDVRRRITDRTRAIIPVDLYGQSVDLDPYRQMIARCRQPVALLEDAAQAFGTPGVGGIEGIVTAFSFYATKNVAMGEGGAVVTTDRALADKVRILSQQGVTAAAYERYHGAGGYDVVEIGFKGNLPDLMAAVGRVQLRKEPAMREMRRSVWERYRNELPLRTILWDRPGNCHLYPVFHSQRERFRQELLKRGVGTGVHYECIPGLTAYRRMGYDDADTPQARRFGADEFTLPLYPGLSESDVATVVTAVKEVYALLGE